MTAVLARSDLTPTDRQALLFAVGKVHDDIGDYEAAMEAFEAANRIRGAGNRLDRQALAVRVDRLIAATPPNYRDRQSDRGVDDPTPILIVGLPRSGSTLTEQILSSHPDVAAGGELGFWGQRAFARAGEDPFRVEVATGDARRLAEDYLRTLRPFGPSAKRDRYDKMLSNFLLIGLIHRVFPNATFVHCRRHPIDNALSAFTTNFQSNLNFVSNRSDLSFYIRQYQRLMAHWRTVLPPGRLVEVDYETVVADTEAQARRLVDAACGLVWSEACLAPHLNVRGSLDGERLASPPADLPHLR